MEVYDGQPSSSLLLDQHLPPRNDAGAMLFVERKRSSALWRIVETDQLPVFILCYAFMAPRLRTGMWRGRGMRMWRG